MEDYSEYSAPELVKMLGGRAIDRLHPQSAQHTCHIW